MLLEEYLSKFLHPERVGTLVYAFQVLDEIGVPEIFSNVEAMVMVADAKGVDQTMASIETFLADTVTDTFTQFGVDIDYRQTEIMDHILFLRFLVTWNTGEGPVISEVTNYQTIYDIDGGNLDMLRELYMDVEGDDVSELDWIDNVSDFLIQAIDKTLIDAARGEEADSAPIATIATSVLNPLRAFSAIYPEAIGVKHVVASGQLAVDLGKLCANYADQLVEIPDPKQLGVHYASLGIISTVPRDQLVDELTVAISLIHGQTALTQQILGEVRKAYAQVGVSNDLH